MWVTVKLRTVVIETTLHIHSVISCVLLIIIYTVMNKYCIFEHNDAKDRKREFRQFT